MIMFPVVFQPQITTNSVIRGLLWPLCQPSSGPLTVCWPRAVFSQLRYACTFGLSSGTVYKIKSREYSSCQSRLPSGWRCHCEATVPYLITVLTRHYFRIPFLLELSLTEGLQTPLQVIWHLNQVLLFWLDPLPQLYLVWKDLSSHRLFCSVLALCLTTGLVVALATWRLTIWVWTENIYDNDRGAKSTERQTEELVMRGKETVISFLCDI